MRYCFVCQGDLDACAHGLIDADTQQHDFDVETISAWFSLSYGNYLVWPRVLMEHMPAPWQKRFIQMADQLCKAFPLWDGGGMQGYQATLRDNNGRYIKDELADYRHPSLTMMEKLSGH